MVKPPKLRFRPGQFFRLKCKFKPGYTVGQIFCCVWVYRLAKEPNIWLFELEERKDLSPPDTGMSVLCEAVSGSVPHESRIKWEPIREAGFRMDPRDYMHGDRLVVKTATVLSHFELISDGEVLSPTR